LPAYANKEQALEALRDWEQCHQDLCARGRDDGQFFGFSEVGLGYLGALTKLIYVPAVRDAGSDAEEGRDSAVKEIVDVVVRNSLLADKNISELKAETKRKYDEIVKPENLSGLRTLQDELNQTLSSYVADAKIELTWRPSPEVQLALPKTEVALREDGYLCSVSRSGHGLQRAFILTMLQHLAMAARVDVSTDAVAAEEVTDAQAAVEALPEPDATLDLILCIEEPEIYQHPSRQRHLAFVLHKLASNTGDGVTRKTQVIYTTHSPIFVGLDRFDQVRLSRKGVIEEGKPKGTKLEQTSMTAVAEQLWIAADKPGQKFTAASLAPRLQTVMTPWVNEGFFADVGC
jgi:putative ATP-dependent endonuclease of OLD family